LISGGISSSGKGTFASEKAVLIRLPMSTCLSKCCLLIFDSSDETEADGGLGGGFTACAGYGTVVGAGGCYGAAACAGGCYGTAAA